VTAGRIGSRIGTVGVGGGVLAMVAGVVALLIGASLLLADVPAPQPLDADGRVELPASGVPGTASAVVWGPEELDVDRELVDSLACRGVDASGEETDALRSAAVSGTQEVAGTVLHPVARTGDLSPGDSIVCDGPAVAATPGLVAGWDASPLRTGGLAALGFGVLALVAGVVFLVVGVVARRGAR
jgi:hypothetical protein